MIRNYVILILIVCIGTSCGVFSRRESYSLPLIGKKSLNLNGTAKISAALNPHYPFRNPGNLGKDYYEFKGKAYIGNEEIGPFMFVNVKPKEVFVYNEDYIIVCYGAFRNLLHYFKFFRLKNDSIELLNIDETEIPIEYIVGQEYNDEANKIVLWTKRIIKHLDKHENTKVTECLQAFGKDTPGWFLNRPDRGLGNIGIPGMFEKMLTREEKSTWVDIIESEYNYFPTENTKYGQDQYFALLFLSKFRDKYIKRYGKLIKDAKRNKNNNLLSDLEKLYKGKTINAEASGSAEEF